MRTGLQPGNAHVFLTGACVIDFRRSDQHGIESELRIGDMIEDLELMSPPPDVPKIKWPSSLLHRLHRERIAEGDFGDFAAGQ